MDLIHIFLKNSFPIWHRISEEYFVEELVGFVDVEAQPAPDFKMRTDS